MKTNLKPHPNRGFTLIEMLLVVAIIGILVSIAVPALNTAKADTQAAKKETIRRAVATAVQRAVIDNRIGEYESINYNHFKAYLVINGQSSPPILKLTDGSQNGTGENILYWGYTAAQSLDTGGSPEEIRLFGEPPAFENDDYYGQGTIRETWESYGLETTPIANENFNTPSY